MLPTEYYKHDTHGVDILFFGMGAGKKDEALRRPFSGPAGKRLRQIINHIWSTTKFNVAFSNNVRFHPIDSNGKDRPPTTEEINRCKHHLEHDIIAIMPRVIVPLGKSAYQTLYPTYNGSVARMNGKKDLISLLHKQTLLEFKVMGTFHPSWIIRDPQVNRNGPFTISEKDIILITAITGALEYANEKERTIQGRR